MKRACEILKRYFGYDSFRPGQEQAVASLLEDEDCLAVMPTGAGKSICFQVPALLKSGLTLVFTPLISLMKDQVDGLKLQKIPATYLNSTLDTAEYNRRMYEVRSGRVKLLYLAPERLESNAFCNVLRELRVSQIIIDEAHCVSQWGHDFRPSYRLIGPFVETLNGSPVIGAFTATATAEVGEDIIRLLYRKRPRTFVTGFDRPNLTFRVMHVSRRAEFVTKYVESHREESGVIYCATRKDVELVYETLTKRGIRAGCYHAGLSDEVRKMQQEHYAYDRVRVMVATNAFGMGIDKSNVRYVLHYQMPRNMESYYQEAGRAGRDGAPSECLLLYNGRDVMIHKYLIDQSVQEPERRRAEFERLQAMTDYCFSSSCLRAYILKYFGERVRRERCDNCSACTEKGETVDLTREAKAIFRAVSATEERFGAGMIASIVSGERTERILRGGYDAMPVFGALSDMSERDIKALIRRLVADGYMRSSEGKYPILLLRAGAESVLDGKKPVLQTKPIVGDAGIRMRRRQPPLQRRGGLFAHLREHRARLAAEAGVPPYLILPDTPLIEIANLRPTTLAELAAVKGIGEIKLKKYGMSFLKSLSEYAGD